MKSAREGALLLLQKCLSYDGDVAGKGSEANKGESSAELNSEAASTPIESKTMRCGLVMPISGIDDYSASHWLEVLDIIKAAVSSSRLYKYDVSLVSDADDAGLIHKRIVQNLYDSDVVVCDVSAKNPNVMFELGMRLAFDKPIVIVKDDRTGYSFDTGVVEHLEYPADLRFSKIIAFKEKLSGKVDATVRASLDGQESGSFLKSFGTFKVQKLQERQTSDKDELYDGIADLQRQMRMLRIDLKRGSEYEPGSNLDRTTALRNALLEYSTQFNSTDVDEVYTWLMINSRVPSLYPTSNSLKRDVALLLPFLRSKAESS